MKIMDSDREGVHLIFCPGCKCAHWFSTTGRTPAQAKGDNSLKGPKWGWNGDRDKPTIQGSILVLTGPNGVNRCHSLINDGKIQFLGDSTHELSGKTVDLPDF